MATRGSLKLDRSLLNPKFEGYKLSLDPLPIYELAHTPVLQVSPDDSQYSLQHVRLYNLHNHLHLDPWNFKCLYFVDEDRHVVRIRFDEHRRFQELKVVFPCPQAQQSETKPGHRFNFSIAFVSSSRVLLGDGAGMLYLLETGDRLNDQQWKVLYKSPEDHFKAPFVLLHGIARCDGGISALLLSVNDQKSSEYQVESTGPFLNVITWIDLASDEFHEWTVFRTRVLVGKGNLEYASLSSEKDRLYVTTNKPYKFVSDSLHPVERSDGEVGRGDRKKYEKPPPLYAWLQTEDDVTVNFKLPKETKKDDVSVSFEPSTLAFVVNDQSLSLSGSLFGKVDVGECAWTLVDNALEITLRKLERGLVWQHLINGDTRGEEIADVATKERILKQLEFLTSENSPLIDNKVAFDNQQLEECDAYPSDYMVMYLINGDSHEVSEHVNLSANQWIFKTVLDPESAVAFCIRHDVDGIVWQPTSNGYEHKITFNALGYVQASKQERKFSGCSPDGAFTAIGDVRKHVYVYHQPSRLESAVRNRKTGQEINAVAHQRVVSLESSSDVLGFQVSNENVYILTSDVVYVVRVRIE